MLQESFALLMGLVVLIAGGELLVRGASAIAYRMSISRLVVGLTIVAFGTSSPELFISVQSALKGSADMAMGNVIGSNICNLGLVLGLTAVLSRIPVDENSLKIDWPMAMGSSLLLFVLVQFGELNWIEGVIFVLILVTYIVYVIRKSRKENKARAKIEANLNIEEEDESEEEDTALWKQWALDLTWLVLGCTGLYFGSEWFVGSAETIFLELGVSKRIIGLMVLALGTSLPELVTSIVAASRGNTDLALGNLIGSNIFNVLSILGITSIVKSITVSDTIREVDMVWMLGITFLILPLMWYKRKMFRLQGVILLAFYGYYVYTVIFVS
ncbi:MAG: calcium/sodium antiporter [Flammeovirgaceae bacterium]